MGGGGKGGGAPAGNTTSVQTTQPWAGQVPYLTGGTFGGDQWGAIPGTQAAGQPAGITANSGILGAMPAAAGLYEGYTPQYFPGQTFAGATAAQNSAITGTENLGANGNPVTNPALNTNNFFLSGTNLATDPAMGSLSAFSGINPTSPSGSALENYATGSMAAAGNPYTTGEAQNVMSSVVPSIESQFISGGDLASPEAAYATSAGATAALAPTLFQNFQTEQQNQLNALGAQETAANALQGAFGQNMQQTLGGLALAPTTQMMPYTDLAQEYNAGATQQSNQQAGINDAVQRYNYNTMLPYNMLNEYIGETTGNYGGTTALTSPYFANQGQSMISNALGGAMLGSTLGGGPLGAGIGALAALALL